jgi:molybdenum cofactor guanylyltransferase
MTGAILAGGKSRRMGFNKAFIRINGETIIERSVKLFKDVFDDVFIVANDVLLYEGLDARVYSDVLKEAGSLGGVYTALFHAGSDWAFVAACDMPYLDAKTIRKVLDSPRKGYEAVVPFIGGRFHPMHALYSKKCLKPIESMIKEGNLRATDLFERIKAMKLSEADFGDLPAAASVENINTKEDLVKIGLPSSE